MKALTTMLAQRAMQSQPAPADGLKAWRDAAQAQIDEPVVDACLFARPTSYAGNALSSHSGPLVGIVLRKTRELRAGGLPPHFVLAVTADEVVVLERTMKSRGGPLGEPGREVTRWKRSDLRVSWHDGGYLYKVKIESPPEPDAIECTVALSPLTESFLGLLSDPARALAAA